MMLSKILKCIAVTLMVTACVTDKDEPVWSLKPGDALPQFSITMNDGSTLSTEELAGDRSVIILFNTSCSDCRRELPIINAAYLTYGDSIRFVAIAREENKASIEEFWQENELSLPYSPQPKRDVYSLFASSGIPRVYVCDSTLHITHVFTPYDL